MGPMDSLIGPVSWGGFIQFGPFADPIQPGCARICQSVDRGPVIWDYTPDPLRGFKWVKDRQGKKTSFWGQPMKLIAFDDAKKAHKARVRAAAMACPGCTWQQAATKGKLNPTYFAAFSDARHGLAVEDPQSVFVRHLPRRFLMAHAL